MLRNIQRLSRPQRLVIFILIFGGGLALILAITVFLILLSLNTERSQSLALLDDVTVAEYMALPDDNAYPATVAVLPDGRVVTASFVSGAVWAAGDDGTLTELPGTRDTFGGVAGLAAGADGSIYVIDQGDSDVLTLGGDLYRILPDGSIIPLRGPGDERGFVQPDDIAIDAQGYLYVTDRGRDEVWRFDAEGNNGAVWWSPPLDDSGEAAYAPFGVAVDATTGTLLITDSNRDAIFRVPLAGGDGALIYEHGERDFVPGLDGLAVGADGTIYLAALAQHGVVRLVDGELEYIAGAFRSPSDLAYADGRLYVSNFDSFSLIVPAVQPGLPFSVDVITLPDAP